MKAIDLFAGAGGFTEGARLAGVPVVWAANHWPVAVETHAANHPEAAHACQDLQQANWTKIPAHDVLLASPACQGHARARGVDRPHHDAARATAWAVIAAAEVHRPAVVIVENVPEFRDWVLFPSWTDSLKRLGYSYTAAVLDAADLGVPQHRRRLFLTAWRGRSARPLAVSRREWIPAETIIEPGGEWGPVSRLCQATRKRITAGRKIHGDRFLIAYYGTERGGRSLAQPLGTVTTVARHGIVEGDRFRMLSVSEIRAAMGFRADYRLPARVKDAHRVLGNAVPPPMAAAVISAAIENL